MPTGTPGVIVLAGVVFPGPKPVAPAIPTLVSNAPPLTTSQIQPCSTPLVTVVLRVSISLELGVAAAFWKAWAPPVTDVTAVHEPLVAPDRLFRIAPLLFGCEDVATYVLP